MKKCLFSYFPFYFKNKLKVNIFYLSLNKTFFKKTHLDLLKITDLGSLCTFSFFIQITVDDEVKFSIFTFQISNYFNLKIKFGSVFNLKLPIF